MKNYFDLTGQVAIITGASTGLGVQMARALANQGCNIVCMARRKNLCDENAAKIAEEFGVKAIGVQCDITDTDRVNAAVDEVLEAFGRIINIASMYGLVGNKVAGSAPYHAAKGGVVNLTRALAAEWSSKGINVNAICPGYFYTPLTKETLDSDFFQANAKTMIPAERYGNEGELDTAAIFLASPCSSYVTGIMVPVDGGYTCM